MTDPTEKRKPQIPTRTPGRLSPGGMFDRVKLRHPIEEIIAAGEGQNEVLPEKASSGAQQSTTENPSTTIESAATNLSGGTSISGSTAKGGTTTINSSTGDGGSTKLSGRTRRIGTTRRTGSTRRISTSGPSLTVAPERDFQRVPNSVTREALRARLFRGKSKQVWDYLWSVSRGAVVPSRTVRRSRPDIKAAAGFGSMGTVDAAIDHLRSVGLLAVRTIVGEGGGNEYEVFTPDEVAAGLYGVPDSSGTTGQDGSTETTQFSVVPVVPEIGNTGNTSTPPTSAVYDEPKTSFKTIGEKLDDDDELRALREAERELTGRQSPPGAWRDVIELLTAEFKLAAGRTTVSSPPAFLAEHLRRRLWKKDQAQLAREESLAPAARRPPPEVDAAQCPDCFGTGMWYPEGFEKGVARCRHEKLTPGGGD